jgi:hypothetical protein
MSVYYPLTNYDQRVYLNPYPHATFTNHPFYISYPYYTNGNDMKYDYSPKDPFAYRYGLGPADPYCRCDVFHTVAECIRKRSAYHCP